MKLVAFNESGAAAHGCYGNVSLDTFIRGMTLKFVQHFPELDLTNAIQQDADKACDHYKESARKLGIRLNCDRVAMIAVGNKAKYMVTANYYGR